MNSDQLAKKEANRQRALDRLKATRQRLLATNQATAQAKVTKPSQASYSNYFKKGNMSKQSRDASRQELGGPSKMIQNYIDYDFSKMEDSKGGFIIDNEGGEPSDRMTLEEWRAKQKDYKAPKPLDDPDAPKCFECGSTELDFRLYNWFKTRVCKPCKEKKPEKYSLLTKTECREDYLLTDPELRDEELLPHIERPNPHQKTYNNMMLYMRYQVEEFAFKKWGGEEGLDAEYERRTDAKQKRKDKKFLQQLREMRKKTRAQAYTKTFEGVHKHEWGEPTEGLNNMVRRRCNTCGMLKEELSLD
ncbi:DNA repair protein Rad14p [Trichomonascus vanleenenianus]|uniref:DNA repair protein RAD14 n=1 Tax=Trichomonascus vanleenenianus TaxID=2268995 RepID=UPI003ECA07D1